MAYQRSENLANLQPSQTVAISTEAKRRRAAGEDVLDLGVGEPDFDTPLAVAEAGIAAIRAGKTRYAPNVGIPELQQAMADELTRLSDGRAVESNRLMISNGSKQALFNACFVLFGPGDERFRMSGRIIRQPRLHTVIHQPRKMGQMSFTCGEAPSTTR